MITNVLPPFYGSQFIPHRSGSEDIEIVQYHIGQMFLVWDRYLDQENLVSILELCLTVSTVTSARFCSVRSWRVYVLLIQQSQTLDTCSIVADSGLRVSIPAARPADTSQLCVRLSPSPCVVGGLSRGSAPQQASSRPPADRDCFSDNSVPRLADNRGEGSVLAGGRDSLPKTKILSAEDALGRWPPPVSYTHLTLPTNREV